MVSLVRTLNTSGSGAVFFDSLHNMDDDEYLQPVLTSLEEEHFQKLNTIPIVSISLIFGVSLEITGIIFISLWPEEKDKCDTYFIYLYLHCAYWLIIMLTDYLVKAKHHRLRIYGYLEFYRSTYQHVRIPLFIASLWITCYLLLAVLVHHTHKVNYEEYCRASEWFNPLNYIFFLTTLELLIIIPVYINYIKKVSKFNRLHPPADVAREEWRSSFAQNSFAGGSEVGYYQMGPDLEELLEKQADLIRCLIGHNVLLNQEVMILSMRNRVQAPT